MSIDEEGRLRRIDYSDKVFYDDTRGIAGTTYPIGTPGMPSNTIADAITLLASLNLKALDIHGAVTIAVDVNHKDFFGNYHESVADMITLGAGNDVSDCHFSGLVITGAQGGGLATYKECLLLNMTSFRGLASRCAIYGTLAVATGDTDYADFDHCTSVHGVITVTIGSPDRVSFKEFSGGMILRAQAAGAVLVRGISGYLEVDDMDGAGATLDIYAHGADIQINDNCAAGTINIYGDARVTVIAGAGATVNNHTIQVEGGALGLTTFGQETAGPAGCDAGDGTTWVTLLDKSTITKPVKICGFKVTKAGTWAGNAKIKITDGAGTKIFPFQAEYEETVDFTDGEQAVLNFPVVVPVASGYKFWFRSSAAGDDAADTLTLDNLDVIEVG